MCFPRVVAFDRLRGRPEVFANCGAVAGTIARLDEQRPPWLAGPDDELLLRLSTRPTRALTAMERQRLAAHGVKVAIFDMNEAKGEAVAQEVGGVFCKCNVTSDADVDAAFEKARAAHGQERILVNCAGTGNAAKTASRDKQTGETKHFPLDAFNWIIQNGYFNKW
jgi:hypothetical protein